MTGARHVSAVRLSAAILPLLALLLAAAGYWLLATDAGTQRMATVLHSRIPALTLTGLEGNLRDGLRLRQLDWRSDGLRLRLGNLQARLDLWAVWTRGVHFHRLEAERLLIELDQGEDEPNPAESTRLPAINLPLGLSVDVLRLGQLAIAGQGDPLHIDHIEARLAWTGHTLRIGHLAAELLETAIEGYGTLDFRDDYPVGATLELERSGIRASARLGGDLRGLRVELRLDQPLAADALAHLDVLGAELPLQAEVSLREPWSTAAGTVDRAVLQLRGTILGTLLGKLSGHLAPPPSMGAALDLTAELEYNGSQLLITDLLLGRPRQLLRAECSQRLDPPLRLECEGHMVLEDLSPWLPAATASLEAPWRAQLALDDPAWQLDLDLPFLQGHWRQLPLTGSLAARASAASLDVRHLGIRIGANGLEAVGKLDDTGAPLRLTLQAPDLAQLDPRLAGSLSGQLSARLADDLRPDQISIDGRLDGRNLQWQSSRVAAARLDMHIREGGLATSRARLQLDNIVGQGDATLQLRGTRAEHTLALEAGRPDQGDLELDCNGDLDRTRWMLTCPNLALNWRNGDAPLDFHLEQPLRLNWETATASLALEPFCLGGDSASLCLAQPFRWQNGSPGPLELEISDIALAWFNHRLPSSWQFTADSRFGGHLQVDDWESLALDGKLAATGVAAQWNGSETPVTLVYDELAIALQGDNRQLRLTALAHSAQLGEVNAALRVDQPRGDRELDGSIRVRDLQLAAFAWALPAAEDLQGAIAGDIAITGSTAAPLLEGRLTLQGGASLPYLTHPLGIDLAADFDANRASLWARLQSGEGEGELSGDLHWPAGGPIQADIRLDGQQWQLAPLPDSTLTISPSLRLGWNQPGEEVKPGPPPPPRATSSQPPLVAASPAAGLVVRGDVAIDRANIVLRDLPENAVRISPDAELVGAEAPPEPNLIPLDVQLRLTLGDQFQFEGFGAEARLAGALDLAYINGAPLQAQGEITIPSGRYDAYGQRLTVRRGSVLFAGDATSPDLDIEAIRDLNRRDITVGIRITGSPRNPYAQLFSEPSMPETTVAYYLLTGKPPGDGTAGSDIVAENILTSLGLAGAESPATRLAERIGIRDLQLGTGTGQYGTEAQISAYLLPRLYVRYGVSLEQDAASLTLQYQLAPRLFLEAISGLDNALDLLYTFERPRREPLAEGDSDGK